VKTKSTEPEKDKKRRASLYMFVEDGASLKDPQLDSIGMSHVYTL
jgi:hypothetical protein